MTKPIKVGASVRFLNAVGGGRVARITKDTAWVEDEDGFEIPTPINECVLVEEGDTFVPKYKPPTFVHTKEVEHRDTPPSESKHRPKVEDFEDFYQAHEESDTLITPQRLPHTYLPASGELRAFLAFIPSDILRLGQSLHECYLINDSAYTLYYVISQEGADTATPQLIQHGILYPEQDAFLTQWEIAELSRIDRISVQLLAFAENPGIFKANVDASIKLDARKLLRLNSFEPNRFFEDKAMLIEVKASSKESRQSEASPELISKLLEQGTQAVKPKLAGQKSHKASPNTASEALVVDLHIDELLDSTQGMDNADILSYQIGVFNKTMQAHQHQTGYKIVFIHGKGDGILRNKLISELKYRYKHCHYQDASFQQYSYGATQVTIGNAPKAK